MSACAFIKPGGGRCKAAAMEGFEHCYGHRSDLASERRRNASRGGKSGGRGRPQTEIAALKQQIHAVIQDVRCGDLPQGQGAVCLQGYNSLLRLREQERREEGGHNLSPEDFSKLTEAVVGVVGRHLHGPALRAFVADLDALLNEDSGGSPPSGGSTVG